jgi:hypothetical protein
MTLKGDKPPRPVFERRVTIKLPYENKPGLNEAECNHDRCSDLRSLATAGVIAPSGVDDGTSVIYTFAVDVATLVGGAWFSERTCILGRNAYDMKRAAKMILAKQS